jgi:nitrogen fixation/metabolism regulation signal transduction histidine kinase
MKKSISLKKILGISFIAGLVVPSFVIGTLFLNFFSSKMKKELVNRNSLLVESMAGEVDKFMVEPNRILKHSSSAILYGLVAEKDINYYLQTILSNYDYFESIVIINEKGIITHSAPYTRDMVGNKIARDSFKNYLNVGDSDGELYLSQTFISVYTNQTTISIAYLKDKKIFYATLNIRTLQRLIDRARITEGYAFITDKKGVVVAHPDRTLVDQRTNFNNLNIVRETIHGNPGEYYFTLNGRKYLGCSQLSAHGNLGVFLVQPVSQIFSPIFVLRNYSLISLLLVFGLMAVIVIVLIGFILRPLNLFVKKTQEVAKGDYSLTHDPGGYTELTEIWKNFEGMIVSIKEREEDLVQAKNYVYSLLNAQSSILVSITGTGHLYQYNNAAIDYGKEHKVSFSDSCFWEAFPFLDEKKDDILHLTGRKGGSISFEVQSSEDSHLYYQVNVYASEFEDQKGGLIRIDDISELKNKESQILQMHKMETIGTLASGLAHDFNNILTGIIGTVSLMEMKLEQDHTIDPDKLAHYIEIMHDTGMRASGIMRQLQTISRGHQVSLHKFDLKKMIIQVIRIFKNTLDKSVTVSVKLPKNNAIVMADQGQIEQVLLNLCVNAAHAMTIMRPEGERWGGGS